MATENEVSVLRRRIGDTVSDASSTSMADGVSITFELPYNHVRNVSVYDNDVLVAAENYTVNNDSGTITFGVAPASGNLLRFDFEYSAYTDAELGSRVDEFGPKQAVVETLLELLADSARLYDYSNGETEDKKSQVFKQLKELIDFYQERLDSEQGFEDDAGNRIGGAVFGERYNPLLESKKLKRRDLSRDDFVDRLY